MDLHSFFLENFSRKDYEKYMAAWLDGIIGEIGFWDDYFSSGGGGWKKGFKKATVYEREFTLESYLGEMKKVVFLDVGSGPLSSCGSKTGKANLEFHAVDPLAVVYKNIKRKYDIRTRVQPEFAMVEKLNEKYSENTFDIVHMRNALDHSFNPFMGLLQMLYVCKINGKIILIHRDDEAEFENYDGFHQWNLKVEGDSFFIWRGNKKFNIAELFDEYIDIKTAPAENREALHEVIITKKKGIMLVEDPLLEVYHRKVFNKLLECLMNNYYDERLQATREEKNMICQCRKQINQIRKKYLKKYLKK